MTSGSGSNPSTKESRSASIVFGFDVCSELSFNYLRTGSGTPLKVEEVMLDPTDAGRLLEESPYRPGQHGRSRVYEEGAGFNLWVDHAGWFRVDPTVPIISVPPSQHPTWREALIWGLPAALCVLARGDMVIHGAAFRVDNGAVILSAPGGHGKTTLVAACVAAGYDLVSEDLVAVDVTNQVVFPGPSVIRLRRDVADQTPPGARLVAEDAEKLHLTLDEVRPGSGDPVPLLGAVFLRPSPHDITLTPVDVDTAVPDLWSVALRVPTDAGRSVCFANVVDLAHGVGAWNLARPPSRSALLPTVALLAEAFG